MKPFTPRYDDDTFFLFVQIPDEQQVQISKNLSSGESAAYNLFLRYQRISFLYPFLLHSIIQKSCFYK